MNQRLLTWLREHKGKRLGIVCESLLIMALGYSSLIYKLQYLTSMMLTQDWWKLL